MENLKTFMGAAYHDGVTLEEVNTFLQGKKFVDLREGNYVAKDKFENLSNELATLKNQTKDYESIKTEYETLKNEKSENAINEKLINAGISKEAIKYVKGDLADKTLEDSDDDKVFKANVATYLKAHPQFASTPAKTKTEEQHGRVILNHVQHVDSEEKDDKANHNSINNAIRSAAGSKVIVDDDVNV